MLGNSDKEELQNKLEILQHSLLEFKKEIKEDLKLYFLKTVTYLDKLEKKVEKLTEVLNDKPNTSTMTTTTREAVALNFPFPIKSEETLDLVEDNLRSDENYFYIFSNIVDW